MIYISASHTWSIWDTFVAKKQDIQIQEIPQITWKD